MRVGVEESFGSADLHRIRTLPCYSCLQIMLPLITCICNQRKTTLSVTVMTT